MAKAKKTTDETTPATAAEGAEPKKPAPKKKAATPKAAAAGETPSKPAAAAKKAPAKKSAPTKPAAPATFGFGIDTNLAAQAAAKMLLNRSTSSPTPTGGTVKHLKDSLNKPATPTLANLLGGTSATGGKASNLPHFSSQQKSHNQSTGPVGNTGVPRRTPG